MPTVSGTTVRAAPGVYVTSWSPFNTTQSQGSSFSGHRIAHATIQFYGTFASKGTIVLQGSNDSATMTATAVTWARLKSVTGGTISSATAAVWQIGTITNRMRPVLVSGVVTTTSVKAKLITRDLRET